MQKLSVKLKNVPRNAPLVPCSTSLSLNRDENLSVVDGLKDVELTDNNLEVDQPQHTEGQKSRLSVRVYVLNIRGQPLMPTSPRKSRIFLKTGKAKVVTCYPFTIQMMIATGETKQDITVAIDPGFENVGYSARTETKELICGELKVEIGMKDRLDKKRQYKQNKRKRLWYREPRFNNRVSTKPKGWIPPSIQRRLDTHLKLVNKVMSLLPVTKVIIEESKFDIQKIKNPEIQGVGYQQGELSGYLNLKSYISSREKGKCQLCGKEYNGRWELHHINGDSNTPSNLALVHEKCHKELHALGNSEKLKKSKRYRAETFMNIIRQRLIDETKKLCSLVEITFGYITNVKRNELGIKKTHYNDAFVASGGIDQERVRPINILQKKRNNRSLQKSMRGRRPPIRRKRYKIQPNDLIWVEGKKYLSKGTSERGRLVGCEDSAGNRFSFLSKQVDSLFNTGSFVFFSFNNIDL